MNQYFFSCTLSRERTWLSNGNVELYSLNNSFEEGVLWKFTMFPTQGTATQGFVEKLKNGQTVQFFKEEAVSAIQGNFLQVQNISPISTTNQFTFYDGRYVSFVLRAPIGQETQLHPFMNKNFQFNFNGMQVNVSTSSSITKTDRFSCVRGLLTLPQVINLEVCAEMLVQNGGFPRHLFTWMNYCTNTGYWTWYW